MGRRGRARVSAPDWINDQAKKNKRKAFRFEFWGMTLIAIAAWLGAGSDIQGLNPLWHLGAAAVAVAFNLGAFAAEYAVIVAQVRLLLEVKAQADRLPARTIWSRCRDGRRSRCHGTGGPASG